jgi:hypothetical protein
VIIGVSQERDRAVAFPLRRTRLEAQPLPGEEVGDRLDGALPEDEPRPGRAAATGVLEEREPAIALAKPDAADLDAAIDMTKPERSVERQRPADVLDIEARLEPAEVHLAPSPAWGDAIRSEGGWGGEGGRVSVDAVAPLALLQFAPLPVTERRPTVGLGWGSS